MQILEKTYRGRDIALMVLLPARGAEQLEALERSLTAEKLNAWSAQLREQEVDVYLPRFELTTDYQLRDTLAAMGMPRLFDAARADLSGIHGGSEPLWLATVLQHALVQVDEAGTVAAAVTMMGGLGGMPPRVPVFRADHPFLFLIRDRRTGSILFFGRLLRPAESAAASGQPSP